ncbi:MAG: nuclear transport factor 2 family protein [Pseudomonadota bacterium]
MNDHKIQTIQKIYKAFGEGNLPAILEQLSDDIDWASEPESTLAPWHGIRRGKAEVPKFFAALASTVEVTRFEPLTFAANETDVLVVIRFGMRVRATGRSAEMDLHHWWRFRGPQIVLYRGTEDTALTAKLLA